MFQVNSPLNSSQRWHVNGQGVCLAEENGVPKACFIFSSGTPVDFPKLQTHLEKNWSVKLVGPAVFLQGLAGFLRTNGYTIAREVERDGEFDVLYDHPTKKFRVSATSAEVTVTQQVEPNGPTRTTTVATPEKVKVLIVDDSTTVRNLLASILKNDPSIEVIGSIDLPSKVEPFILKNRPDVITLDIHMPEMDGVQLLKQIQPKFGIPTIMISSLSQEDGPYVFDALELGAFDYIKKPSFNEIANVGPVIIERIKVASRSARKVVAAKPATAAASSVGTSKISDKWDVNKHLILVGSSTGGTEALRVLFSQFPDEIPPVLVVQHIPAVFSKALADRLNTFYKFTVKEAEDNDLVAPNQILIAPGGKQMGIRQRGSELRVYITDDPPMNRHKPSVDYMYDSAVKLKGHDKMIGIILTGMGADGARGLKALRDLGAYTLTQDEESSVVYGMPKAAYEMGASVEVANLNRMGYILSRYMQNGVKKKAG